MTERNYIAACYCRLSKEDETDGSSISIETQRKILGDYCERNRLIVYGYYIDDGYSGTDYDRPSFQRMLDDIEDGKINCVVTKDLSRLGRNYIETGRFLENYFPEKNVRFIAVGDNVDTRDEYDYDDLIIPIRNLFNQAYPADISKKIRQAFKTKANNGEFFGAYAPYGYKKSASNKNILEIDDEAAETVVNIFKLAAYEGYGYKRLSKKLRRDKVLTPSAYRAKRADKPLTGNPYNWNAVSLRLILNNQVYLGRMVNAKTRKISFKNKKVVKVPEEDWIIVEHTHSPIISEQLWNDAHKKLSERKRVCNTGETHMFSGLVYCGACGSALSTARNGSGHRVLSCTRYKQKGKDMCSCHYIRYDDLYNVVLSDVKAHIARLAIDEEAFTAKLKKRHDALNGADADKTEKAIREYEKQREEYDNRFYTLYNDRLNGILPEDKFATLSKRLESEQREIKNRINILNSQLGDCGNDGDKMQRFSDLLREVQNLKSLDKALLNNLIDKIIVSEREIADGKRFQNIEIRYKFMERINGSL